MAYTILNTDGTVLLLLADGTIDKTATSLTLIGKNFDSYGQELNNNFVKLLANFASTSGTPPRSPIKGQIWYDTTVRRLKVYDNGFKIVGGVTIAASQPSSLQTGDLWFDSSSNQLKLYNSGNVYNIGPSFPSNAGENGWVMPATVIKDQSNISKQVLLLKSYGNTVGISYFTSTNASFEMNLNDLNTYVPNATTSTVVSGLTLIGDLRVSGQITNNYLSINVDLDVISPNLGSNENEAKSFGGTLGTYATTIQNPRIGTLLGKVFPSNATTATNSSTVMTGVPLGTQARVVCRYSRINGLNTSGYQVRIFRTVGTQGNTSWQPFYFTTATIGGASSIPINFID